MIEIIFGMISGIVTSLGMGGGTVLILLLTLLQNINQHISQATNLVFFIPTAITSIMINIKNKQIDFKISKNVILYGIFGAILGSFISTNLPNKILKKIFGIFLFLIAIFQIYEIYTSYRNVKKSNNKDKA